MSWSGFGGLDLSGVEAEKGRTSLKPGAYTCRITGAEIKKTANGHGLRVDFEEVNGAGKTHELINVENRTAMAQEIGRKRLKSLLIACGHPNPDRPGDVKTLIGKTVGIHIEQGPEWRDDSGNMRPGGGEPRKSGAYFKPPVGTETGSSSGASLDAFSSGGSSRDLDDDIPF